MATTTNFGWETPDDTDLVKDGAAAIRTALGGVDTSFVDLKGGTTGQVLAKASSADLDFVWSADAAGMTNPMTTTGDVIYSSSGSTPARLGIGTAGQVLKVNSGATAPEWGSASNGLTLSEIATGSMSGVSVSFSSLTDYDQITVFIKDCTFATANSGLRFRLNGSSSSIYNQLGGGATGGPSVIRNSAITIDGFKPFNSAIFNNTSNIYAIKFTNCKASGFTYMDAVFSFVNVSGNQETDTAQGWFASSATVSSIEITTAAGYSFNGGTYYVIAG